MANNDLASTISKMLGAKIEKVEKRMDALDINKMIALVDAVAVEDSNLVHSIISGKMSEDEDDEDTTDDDLPEFDDPEVSDEFKHDPLEETTYDVNIGDQVSVGDKEGIVKIAHGPNDTVGILIDGNMTMVQRGELKPLKEHVMGMTMMPDLRRMQELAGISINDLIEPQEETNTQVEVIDLSDKTDEYCDPKIKIDAAIEQIEELLPQLKVGDYREVTQRIQKAMNVIYENLQIFVKPVRLSESYVQVRSETLAELQRMLSDITNLMVNVRKTSDLVAGGYNRAFGGIEKLISSINDVITKTTLKKKQPPVGESSPNRRSFKDYLQELDNNQQTIGRNRTDAIKALKTRMGDTATIQDATKAFDQMKTTGKIKQQGNRMTMAPMGDEDLDKTIAGNSGVNAPK